MRRLKKLNDNVCIKRLTGTPSLCIITGCELIEKSMIFRNYGSFKTIILHHTVNLLLKSESDVVSNFLVPYIILRILNVPKLVNLGRAGECTNLDTMKMYR